MTKARGGKRQAILGVQQVSQKLTVKMPFNKSSSSSDQLKELDIEEPEQPKSKKQKRINLVKIIKLKMMLKLQKRRNCHVLKVENENLKRRRGKLQRLQK